MKFIMFLMLVFGFHMSMAVATTDETDFISIYMNGSWMQIDLNNDAHRAGFRNHFMGTRTTLGRCIEKADNGVAAMHDRDAGITLAQHLTSLENDYETAKLAGENVVWHEYIDFIRMVRDIHRLGGHGTESKYKRTDASAIWNHEFKWCAIQ